MTTMQFALGFARKFDGQTFDQVRDGERLSAQLDRVRDFMADGNWHTLDEIAKAVKGNQNGVSARLRDLRKVKFGSHTIKREYLHDGIWQYRMEK